MRTLRLVIITLSFVILRPNLYSRNNDYDVQTEHSQYNDSLAALIDEMIRYRRPGDLPEDYVGRKNGAILFQVMKEVLGDQFMENLFNKLWYGPRKGRAYTALHFVVDEEYTRYYDEMYMEFYRVCDIPLPGALPLDTTQRWAIIKYLNDNNIKFHGPVQYYEIFNKPVKMAPYWYDLPSDKFYLKYLKITNQTEEELPRYRFLDIISQLILKSDKCQSH